MLGFGNQIANIISQYLPYTSDTSIGTKYQAEAVEVGTEEIIMTFEESAYDIISAIINDVNYPNDNFTITGFYLKNRVKTFQAYPDDSTVYYGITIDFELPHKLSKDDIFDFKGFTDTDWNIEYKVLKVISNYSVVIYPTSSITIATVTTGFGYLPTQYTEGLNGIKVISDEGSGNKLSFTFDEDDFFTIASIDDLDLDFLPYLTDYTTSIKVINAATFLSNLADSETKAYLIIDTTSLVGNSSRSKDNISDNPYSTFSRSGRFDKNYTMNIRYILERNTDDENNQTGSGSDIDTKQINMHDALTSITRQPLQSDSTRTISSLTISNDSASPIISEGRVDITYQMQFSIMFNDDIMIKIEDKNTYKINYVKVNTDEVNFS